MATEVSRFDTRLMLHTSVWSDAARPLMVPFTAVIEPWDGTVSISVSPAVEASLPEAFTVSMQVWDGAAWFEPDDARWFLSKSDTNEVSDDDTRKLTGINLWRWFAAKAVLDDSTADYATGVDTIPTFYISALAKTGSKTYVKAAHGLAVGDQVRVVERGSNRTLKKGATYYVRTVPSSSQFTLSSTRLGSQLGHGSLVGGLKLRRIADTILAPGHQFENGAKVRLSSAGGGLLSTKRTYFVVRRTADTFRLATKSGGRAIDVGVSVGMSVARYVDGKRKITGTAGSLLRRAFVEAQERGWAPGLLIDFTSPSDSSDVAWPDSFRWPVELGSTTKDLIDLVVGAGFGWVTTRGRTLRIVVNDPAADLSESKFLVGVETQPTSRSNDALLTHATVTGRGRVRASATVANPVATSLGLGRLEAYESTDTTANTYAFSRATRIVQLAQTTQVERSAGYTPSRPAVLRPLVDFKVRDIISAKVGDSWEPINVVNVTVRVTDDAASEVDVTMGTKQSRYATSVARAIAKQNLKSQVSRIAKEERRAKAAKAKVKKK